MSRISQYEGINRILTALPALKYCGNHIYQVQPDSNVIKEVCCIRWPDTHKVDASSFAMGVLTSYSTTILNLLCRIISDVAVELDEDLEKSIETVLKQLDSDIQSLYDTAYEAPEDIF